MKKIDMQEIVKKLDFQKFTNRMKDRQFKKRFIFTLIIALVVLAVFARATSNLQKALFKKKPEAAKKGGEIPLGGEEVVPVKAYKVKKIDFKDTLPCIGNVKGFKEVDLKFQVSGIIESFNFEEGEKIQEGDIIASLIQRDALLKLKYAELELGKMQKLFEIGAIDRTKMEQSKLEYESAKSELDKTNIYAMSNGLLGSKLLDTGSYVSPNDKIGVFVNIDKVYAEFNIIEKDVPKLALGQKAEVFADAYPNKSFAGSIDRLSPIIEGRSKTENIKVELDNKEAMLKPGMFVRALISTYEKKDAIVAPVSALKKKETEYYVYVINPETKDEKAADKPAEAKKRKIFGIFPVKEKPKAGQEETKAEYGIIEVRALKVGYITQDLVEVAEGLKEGETIAIEIYEELKDKARVEVSEVQEGLF